MWKLNNTLLNNQYILKIKREIKNYPKTNENKNITYQILWHAAKALLRGKFVAINAYFKKLERSQINNLCLN